MTGRIRQKVFEGPMRNPRNTSNYCFAIVFLLNGCGACQYPPDIPLISQLCWNIAMGTVLGPTMVAAVSIEGFCC